MLVSTRFAMSVSKSIPLMTRRTHAKRCTDTEKKTISMKSLTSMYICRNLY